MWAENGAATLLKKSNPSGAMGSPKRNRVLGITAGSVAALSHAFLHPELIIAGLLYTLTGSPMLVALVTVINKGAVTMPQLWASTHLEHRPRKMPYLLLVGAIRTVCFAGLIASLWLMAEGLTALTLALFFVAYTLTCICAGAAHVVILDISGNMIPPSQLGSFFGLRNFVGTILGMIAGVAVMQPILTRMETPADYLVLVSVGAALALAGVGIFGLCREGINSHPQRRTTVTESLRRGFHWLRIDHNYRMYLLCRLAFRINYLGLAFFIPYGSEKLASGGTGNLAVLGGILVATMQISSLSASLIWGRVADRWGFRPCFVGAGVLFLLSPSLALLAPMLPTMFNLQLPGCAHSLDLPLTIYMIALAAVAAAIEASYVGGHYFTLTNAPDGRRSSYVGFINSVTTPLTLLPFVGAVIADHVGMSMVFVVVVGGGVLSLLAAVRMKQPVNRNQIDAKVS